MGQAARRKKSGAKSRDAAPSRLVTSIGVVDGAELGMFGVQLGDAMIHGVSKKGGDSISITFVRPTEGKTHSYTYHSVTGAVDRDDEEFDGDWIGSISVSRSIHSRVAQMVGALLSRFGLPTTAVALQKTISERSPDAGDTWRVKMSDEKDKKKDKLLMVCLPRLLAFFQGSEESLDAPPDTAVVTNVTVAPHHQKKGYGMLLHLCLAQYLHDEGFKWLSSDEVGMNTDGELAVWKKLQSGGAQIANREPMDHICIPRLLYKLKIVDRAMYKFMNSTMVSHFGNHHDIKIGKLEKINFPQYDWDLSKPVMFPR